MKLAKRTLAVFLACLMAFSAFSIAGSALTVTNANNVIAASNGKIDSHVTIALDIYKVKNGSFTAVSSGDKLSPGDVIEVRVRFGTDFPTSSLKIPIMVDRTYFKPYLNGKVFDNAPGTPFQFKDADNIPAGKYGDATGFYQKADGLPATALGENGASGTGTFFDTIPQPNGMQGTVNKTNIDIVGEATGKSTRRKLFPSSETFRLLINDTTGAAVTTYKGVNRIKPEFDSFDIYYAEMNAGADGSAAVGNLQTAGIPEAVYYSFQMIIPDGVATPEGETTPIIVPMEARSNAAAENSYSSLNATYMPNARMGGGTPVPFGHGFDLSGAEYQFTIGAQQAPQHTHVFDEGVETTAPTCTEPGVRTFTCTDPNCDKSAGYTYTSPIPALGHAWEVGETVAATCVAQGYTVYNCSRCHTSENRDYVPATGIHSWGEYTITVQPGCETTGTKVRTCTSCGAEDTPATVPAKGHDWGDWAVTTPAQIGVPGVETRVCKNDPTHTETREIPALEATDANYTVEVYTMGTDGSYAATPDETLTFTGKIGTTVDADTSAYERTGFEIDTTNSKLSDKVAKDGSTKLVIKVARVQVTYDFCYKVGTSQYTTFADPKFYYGAEVILPTGTPSVEGYEFKYWALDENGNERFTGGTAGTENVKVYAYFEEEIDPDARATDEDWALLNTAILGLPDPENLYYYTDEAILWVANALGGGYTSADKFIEDSIANVGYKYIGSETGVAVREAAATISHLATPKSTDTTTLNGKNGTIKPNRDESKAHATITIVPVEINGNPITATDRTALNVQKDDKITFAVYGTTDYYVHQALFPIVYDCNMFSFIDGRGKVSEWDGRATLANMFDTTNTTDDLVNNYEISCMDYKSTDLWYGADCDAAYKAQYKYLLASVATVAEREAETIKFEGDNSFLFTFQMQAKDVGTYDGSITTEIGTIQDWYTPTVNGSVRSQGITIQRAAGYLADGVTPATHGANDYSLPYAWSFWDTAAYGGQTYTAENATVVFGKAAHIHVFGDGVVTAPTCTEQGYTTYTCTDPECDLSAGYTYQDNFVPANGHTWGDWADDPANTATCTEAGKEIRECSVCHTTESRDKAALGHDWVKGNTVAPTCVDDGYTVYTCSRCDATENRDTVPATGIHTWSDWADDPANTATCTAAGKEIRECSVCHTTESRDKAALGHDWVKGNTVAPTCVDDGYTVYTCSRCDATENRDTVPATGIHTWSDWADDPTNTATCTEAGKEIRECSVCHTTESRDKAALGHDWVKGNTVAPTCVDDGYTVYNCSRCDATENRDTVPATGNHTWGDWADDPANTATCTAAGKEIRECSVCHTTESRDKAALGHDWVKGNTVAPTCVDDGYTVYNCSRCDATENRDTVPATGIHTWGAWADDPANTATCTEAGKEIRECSVCHTTESRDKAALGHNWDAGVVTTEPGCETEGVKTFTCQNDNSHTYTEAIPAKGHDWGEWTVVKAPTYDAEGLERRVCKNDASHVEERAIPKLVKLTLKASVGGEGNEISVTVPYSRKSRTAFTLTANMDGVTYSVDNGKALTVNGNGDVTFKRLCVLSRNRNINITATAPNGQTAKCHVTIKLAWWQYIIWALFGFWWF